MTRSDRALTATFAAVIGLAAVMPARSTAAPAPQAVELPVEQPGFRSFGRFNIRMERAAYAPADGSGRKLQLDFMLRNVSRSPVSLSPRNLGGTMTIAGSALSHSHTAFVAGTGASNVSRAVLPGQEIVFRLEFIVPEAATRQRLSVTVKESGPRVLGVAQFGSQTLPISALPAPAAPHPPAAPAPPPPPPSPTAPTLLNPEPPPPPIWSIQEGAQGPADGSFRVLGPLRVRLDSVIFGASAGQNSGLTRLYATVQNLTTTPLAITADTLISSIVQSDGVATAAKTENLHPYREQPFDREFPVTLQPGEYVKIDIVHYLRDRASQERAVHWQLASRLGTQTSLSFDLPRPRRDPATSPPAPPPPPPPAPAANALDLRPYAGVFQNHRNDRLTLMVVDNRVIGTAVTEQGAQRESFEARPTYGRRLEGTWREQRDSGPATGVIVLDLDSVDQISGVWDGQGSTSGYAAWRVQTGSQGQGSPAPAALLPVPLSLPAPPAPPPNPQPATLPGPGPTPTVDATSGAVEFEPLPFLDLRVDRVARSGSRVEVIMTALNSGESRKGVQYDPHRYVLVGSDGRHYGWDGNYYGESGAKMLNDTVWMEPRDEAKVTYVYPAVPTGVTPVQLLVRDGGTPVATITLPR